MKYIHSKTINKLIPYGIIVRVFKPLGHTFTIPNFLNNGFKRFVVQTFLKIPPLKLEQTAI